MADAVDPAPITAPPQPRPSARALLPLTLTTIGVVYGDIGTSPLYTIRECFFGSHSVPPTPENVLGVLSLIIYALLIVISIKYIAIVMRADNRGEGGILALTALLPTRGSGQRPDRVLIALGIFGAALLYGDGMITPAITVLGAVEGLKVATPLFDPYVVPIAVVILDRHLRDPAARHAPGRPAVRSGDGAVVHHDRGPRPDLDRQGAGRALRDQSASTRSPSSRRTGCTASPCWARCSWRSPAARRCTPTWATSESGRFASPGSRWCCRRC